MTQHQKSSSTRSPSCLLQPTLMGFTTTQDTCLPLNTHRNTNTVNSQKKRHKKSGVKLEFTRYGSPPQREPSPEKNVSHSSRTSWVDTVGLQAFLFLRRVRSLMTSESRAALGGGNQDTVRRYNEEAGEALEKKITQTPPWQLGAT